MRPRRPRRTSRTAGQTPNMPDRMPQGAARTQTLPRPTYSRRRRSGRTEGWAQARPARSRSGPEEHEPDTPRIRIASPVDTVSSASTEGPGSAWRASVGVSTIWPCSLRCHGDLISDLSACNASECLDTACPKQRLMGNDVPDFRAGPDGQSVQKVAAGPGSDCTVNAVARFPPSPCLKRGPPVVSSLGRLLRFRSIPWPPAPIGRAFCAFRS